MIITTITGFILTMIAIVILTFWGMKVITGRSFFQLVSDLCSDVLTGSLSSLSTDNNKILTSGDGPYRTSSVIDVKVIDGVILDSPPKKDIVKWLWRYDLKKTNYGAPNYGAHQCPKCRWYKTDDSYVPKICECDDYSKVHFHFQCFKCDYQAIMKTADDTSTETNKKGTVSGGPG